MAVHTFTLSDVQEAALTAHVEDLNVRRVAEGKPPYRHNDEFFADKVRELVTPVVRNYNTEQFTEIRDLFEQADLALRQNVKDLLTSGQRPAQAGRP